MMMKKFQQQLMYLGFLQALEFRLEAVGDRTVGGNENQGERLHCIIVKRPDRFTGNVAELPHQGVLPKNDPGRAPGQPRWQDFAKNHKTVELGRLQPTITVTVGEGKGHTGKGRTVYFQLAVIKFSVMVVVKLHVHLRELFTRGVGKRFDKVAVNRRLQPPLILLVPSHREQRDTAHLVE